jgi:hypothetical protein
MRFNKEQKEGLARVQDTLAVSAMIGVVLGVTGHSQLTNIEIALLISVSLVLVVTSLFIRK